MRNPFNSAGTAIRSPVRWWSAAQQLGLRAKFNIALVPLVAAALSVLVLLDYRHEFRSIMDAHDIHVSRVELSAGAAPVLARTTPDAVARRTIGLHVVGGAFVLVALVLGVNLLLSRLVLTPIARLRAGIDRLQRGFHAADTAAAPDKIRDVVAAFSDLGLTLDAALLHALQTERLATLALLSKSIAGDVEPEVQRLVFVAMRLQQASDEAVRDAGSEIAGGAGRILAALRRLDRPFAPNAHKPAA